MRTSWLSAFALLLALSFGLASTAKARYAFPQLTKVPVERVLKNLQDSAAAEPKDAKLQFNLARAYAMSYAKKLGEFEMRGADIWYGFEPRPVPFDVTKIDDKEAEAQAKKHLEQAIAAYAAGLKLSPDDLIGQLGHAWCLEQAGQQDAAIAGYRQVIKTAWESESKAMRAGIGQHFFTVEAARYLTPLLDKEKDAAENDDLAAKTKKLQSIPRPVTPIAVPLQDGLAARDIEDRAATVAFDVDGTGRTEQRWSWIKPNAGWLVIDRQGSGKVDSALQLFGNVTFWMFWDHGYEPLAALDDNRDGELRGSELAGLAIWHDANQNGVSDAGEVQPLSAHGIVALSCRHEIDEKHADRIEFSAQGVSFSNGKTRPTFDLRLHGK